MLLRVDFVDPRCHSIFSISGIDDSLMNALAQSFLVEPVVTYSSFDLRQVDFLGEIFELLKFVFAEDSQEGA